MYLDSLHMFRHEMEDGEIDDYTATIILSGDENKLEDDLNNISIHNSILDYVAESVKEMEMENGGNDVKTFSEEKDKNNKKEGSARKEAKKKGVSDRHWHEI